MNHPELHRITGPHFGYTGDRAAGPDWPTASAAMLDDAARTRIALHRVHLSVLMLTEASSASRYEVYHLEALAAAALSWTRDDLPDRRGR